MAESKIGPWPCPECQTRVWLWSREEEDMYTVTCTGCRAVLGYWLEPLRPAALSHSPLRPTAAPGPEAQA